MAKKLNFTFQELINSDTAKKNKINNYPDIKHLDNLLNLIVFCLQPIRDIINKPMIITSGYRTQQLNAILGGAKNSHHCRGMAVDFVIKNMSVEQIVDKIRKSNIKFTQLIEEHSKSDTWVHISYDNNNLKCEVLRYKNGLYEKI